MKKQLVAIAIASALSTGAACASESANPEPAPIAYRNQAIGFGVGSIAGALIAGPPGLVVGSIFGALTGWSEGLQEELDARQQALAETKTELAAVHTRNGLQVAQATAAPVLDTPAPVSKLPGLDEALTADFSLDIYFRSGSSMIEPYYQKRLDAIASLLNAFPDLHIELEGYADRRGTDAQNIRLSTERIHSVKATLMSAGVDPQRMLGDPRGERQPVTKAGDAQTYAFDRRVQLRLSLKQPPGGLPVAQLDATAGETPRCQRSGTAARRGGRH